MKEDKTKIINTDEFQTLFDKSKNLIDNARNSMGQIQLQLLQVFCLVSIL